MVIIWLSCVFHPSDTPGYSVVTPHMDYRPQSRHNIILTSRQALYKQSHGSIFSI